MNSFQNVQHHVSNTLFKLFNINDSNISVNNTNPEFDGDYTIVLFSLAKQLKKSPVEIGELMGNYLLTNYAETYREYNQIKGFLNLTLHPNTWVGYLENIEKNPIVQKIEKKEKIMIEFSSPNTNKPLHVGHLRNNFLGQSLSNIYSMLGYEVIKTCIVNDRGIHICKSMLAWQEFGKGETPDSTHKKGDHFVGDYYVKFNEIYKKQADEYVAKYPEKIIENKNVIEQVPILLEAQEMLQKWENNDPAIREIWAKMNNWVYSGFEETYKRIGTTFDKIYYESEIYVLGKSFVELGLQKNVFYKAPDNSVWIDLSKEGYDQKIVQRKDGTSVYITQDLALAQLKQQDFRANKSMYIVGDEQNYHFQVLKLICEKLKMEGAEQIFHLSYGMVELPSGKMKSREGTVVDADDLIDTMIEIAKQKTNELSKTDNFNEQELLQLYNTIGLGALKFFLLRVNPANKMVFNPEESIDFKGFTAPFIQYTFARIQSLIKKSNKELIPINTTLNLHKLEIDLIKELEKCNSIIHIAAQQLDPSQIAIYVFGLAKLFNHFYAQLPINKEIVEQNHNFRIKLSKKVGETIQICLQCLQINVPDRM